MWTRSLRFPISAVVSTELLQEHPYYEESGRDLPAPALCSLVPSPCIFLYRFLHFFFHLLLLHWKSDTTVIKNNSIEEIKATTIKGEKKEFQLMTSIPGGSLYGEVEQYWRTFRRKTASQPTKIHFASWCDDLFKPFLSFSEPYWLTAFSSHSHAFLFSLLLLWVNFDLGRFFVLLLEQGIRQRKILVLLLSVQ